MTVKISSEQRLELKRIWDALIRLALSKGIPIQDAEDVVSNSLRSALEHHDSTRGELLPFCRTILYNAMKNYWRDRKVDLPLEDERWQEEGGAPDILLEEKERAESMKRTIEQLSTLLSREELAFMKMLGQVVDELGERAVSETARRLGLKPAKGWDLFRRIQRKAKSLEAPEPTMIRGRIDRSTPRKIREAGPPAFAATAKEELAKPSSERPAPVSSTILYHLAPLPDPLLTIAGAMARQEGFERFMRSL